MSNEIRERAKERKRERLNLKDRERETRSRRGVDIVATNITAATVSKLGVTSSPRLRRKEDEKKGGDRNTE